MEQALNGIVHLNEGTYKYQVGKGGAIKENGGTSYFNNLNENTIELTGGKPGTLKYDLINSPVLGGEVTINKFESAFGKQGITTIVEGFDKEQGAFIGAKSVFSGITDNYSNSGAGGNSADNDIIGDGLDASRGIGGFIRITYVGQTEEKVNQFKNNPQYIY